MASRKIYDVSSQTPGKLAKESKKKRRALSESSSDSDSPKKPRRESQIRSILNSMEEDINNITADVLTLTSTVDSVSSRLDLSNNMLKEITTVSSALPLPIKVIKLVNDAFKFKICLKLPMHPPIIGTRCCNTLLGCADCINNWYSGDEGLSKTCPNCREARGYAQTFQFKGIDEFLEGFRTILYNENSEDES